MVGLPDVRLPTDADGARLVPPRLAAVPNQVYDRLLASLRAKVCCISAVRRSEPRNNANSFEMAGFGSARLSKERDCDSQEQGLGCGGRLKEGQSLIGGGAVPPHGAPPPWGEISSEPDTRLNSLTALQ